ncbi:MAG: hypothetical protein OWT27_00655 [Firmicutes bacterium]|nr:hypothetical protein [Bacillota bacterium]
MLLIAPQDGFAIGELREVWPEVRPAPDVVWVGTTRSFARRDWSALGYRSDPLPSPKTLFVPQEWASPAAFRSDGNHWMSVSGLAARDQAQQWVGFFDAQN